MSFKSHEHNKVRGNVTTTASGKDVGYSAAYTGGEVSKGSIEASGGTEFESGDFKFHVFTSTGNFVVADAPSLSTMQFMLIGGGGNSSGNVAPGGSGAGGFVTGTTSAGQVDTGTHVITVGGGGGNTYVFNPSSIPGPGSREPNNSNDITSIALAGGGSPSSPGGSGSGGNGFSGGSSPVGAGTPGQGKPGGPGHDSGAPYYYRHGGGGGGAGAPGSPGRQTGPTRPDDLGYGGVGKTGFDAFDGIPSSYGTPGPSPGRWFAGGGASAGPFTPNDAIGGAGGGGSGNPSSDRDGDTNTGGGAAGGNPGNNGGSGIVIIRYTKSANYNYPSLPTV